MTVQSGTRFCEADSSPCETSSSISPLSYNYSQFTGVTADLGLAARELKLQLASVASSSEVCVTVFKLVLIATKALLFLTSRWQTGYCFPGFGRRFLQPTCQNLALP
jgi:hypothetical protein